MAQAFIGTSGFDYLEWKPGFYPGDLPRKRFLSYYASRFKAVELNNTFYRIPDSTRIAAWSAATPDGFRFSLKAPRRITHFERLKTPSSALDLFIKVAAELGPRLGALLFQLPPYLKCDGERLGRFWLRYRADSRSRLSSATSHGFRTTYTRRLNTQGPPCASMTRTTGPRLRSLLRISRTCGFAGRVIPLNCAGDGLRRFASGLARGRMYMSSSNMKTIRMLP